MLAYIIWRLLQAVLVMGVMSGLVFVGLYVIGDPVSMMASPEATELDREAIRESFGLDKPLWQQYAVFMSHGAAGLWQEPPDRAAGAGGGGGRAAGHVGGATAAGPQFARHHDRVGAGSFAAQLLGRPDSA